jgi:hypothetical protein
LSGLLKTDRWPDAFWSGGRKMHLVSLSGVTEGIGIWWTFEGIHHPRRATLG